MAHGARGGPTQNLHRSLARESLARKTFQHTNAHALQHLNVSDGLLSGGRFMQTLWNINLISRTRMSARTCIRVSSVHVLVPLVRCLRHVMCL